MNQISVRIIWTFWNSTSFKKNIWLFREETSHIVLLLSLAHILTSFFTEHFYRWSHKLRINGSNKHRPSKLERFVLCVSGSFLKPHNETEKREGMLVCNSDQGSQKFPNVLREKMGTSNFDQNLVIHVWKRRHWEGFPRKLHFFAVPFTGDIVVMETGISNLFHYE